MNYSPTALERAFQLAKDGSCHSVLDIKKQLRAEGFSVAQITGKSLYKQLKGLLQGHESQAQTLSVLCGHDHSSGIRPAGESRGKPDPDEAPSD